MIYRCCIALALMTVQASAGLEPDLKGQEFMMPSGNVTCMKLDAIDDGDVKVSDRLYCLRYLPTPLVVILEESGVHSQAAGDDQPFGRDVPVLAYGKKWYKEGFTCKSEVKGVVCSHNKFGAFRLSRKGFEKLQ
jgi:hypothetical protein